MSVVTPLQPFNGTLRIRSEEDMAGFGQALAKVLGPSDTVLLKGTLGAGKTVLARSIIRSLAGDPALKVPSPTYTLVQTYDSPRGPIHHFDLFRVRESSECQELGMEELLGFELSLVEWPERLGSFAPRLFIEIELSISTESAGERCAVLRHSAEFAAFPHLSGLAAFAS